MAAAVELARGDAGPDVLGFDLMTYDCQRASVTGVRGELVSSPRLDNLASCHAAVSALVEAAGRDLGAATRMIVLYDHEEVGSRSAQGAAGTQISIDQAVPGDLVVMPGHIGFYAGNGQILHAPYEGTSVRVQPIWTSDYWIVRI